MLILLPYIISVFKIYSVAIFMFKVKHKLLLYILDLFSETPSNYHLRNFDFYIPRFNSVRHEKHSLAFFGPRLWSKLSPGDRERQKLTTFMANIRKRYRGYYTVARRYEFYVRVART